MDLTNSDTGTWTDPDSATKPVNRPGWGWMLALGIAQIILGLFALSATFFVTLASALVFGVAFLVGGVLQLMHSFGDRDWSGFFLHQLVGIFSVLAGLSLMVDPLGGVIALTLVLSIYFVAAGITRMVMAFGVGGRSSGVWLFVAGLIDLLLGVLIFRGWPVSGLWVIGLFVGIELLMSGWTAVMLWSLGPIWNAEL